MKMRRARIAERLIRSRSTVSGRRVRICTAVENNPLELIKLAGNRDARRQTTAATTAMGMPEERGYSA